VGATLKVGMRHMRMGRYGVATTEMRGMKMPGREMEGMHMHEDLPKPNTR
jgi:hypothetical protein